MRTIFFSNGQHQKGLEDEGIQGFLQADTIKILKTSEKYNCHYCKEPNASTKCNQCEKRFHYTCGQSNEATFVLRQNSGKTTSYCHDHFPASKHKLKHEDR